MSKGRGSPPANRSVVGHRRNFIATSTRSLAKRACASKKCDQRSRLKRQAPQGFTAARSGQDRRRQLGKTCWRRAIPLWADYSGASGVGASSADAKPQRLCVPSQNGRRLDCPQRHSATAGLSGFTGNTFPFESIIVTGPSTRNGPLGRTRIVVVIVQSSSGGGLQRRARVAAAVTSATTGEV